MLPRHFGRRSSSCLEPTGEVDADVLRVQKQAYGSNNCALFAAAFQADIYFGRSAADAVYVDSQNQRNWFAEVLRTGIFCPCPREAKKPSRFAETNPRESRFFCSG